MNIDITKKSVLKIAGVVALIFLIAFGSFAVGVNSAYYVAKKEGFKEGYLTALTDVADKTGITFQWHDLGNGMYEIEAFYEGALIAKGVTEVHCEVEQRDAEGNLISRTFHDGTLTTIGKNWIEDQLGDSPATDPAKWIACSNTTDSVVVGWTELPDEITTDGLARAAGSYASTGDGAWNETYTFSVTGTNSTVCYGLHWAASGDNNLICAENQGAGNRKNVNDGDTLKVTWQVSVS